MLCRSKTPTNSGTRQHIFSEVIPGVLWIDAQGRQEIRKKLGRRARPCGSIGFFHDIDSAGTADGSPGEVSQDCIPGSGSACEPTLHRGRVHQACLLELEAAARKDREVRNTLHLVP